MLLSVGGVCCHDWTDEPLYPGTDPEPVRHAEDCNPEWCMVSWVNFPDKKESIWWTVCTF